MSAREEDEAPPPFLLTWRRVYAAVLCYAVVLIGCLYLLTRWFRSGLN
jgi:hypothetical protein